MTFARSEPPGGAAAAAALRLDDAWLNTHRQRIRQQRRYNTDFHNSSQCESSIVLTQCRLCTAAVHSRGARSRGAIKLTEDVQSLTYSS